jgi:hypothetical protein
VFVIPFFRADNTGAIYTPEYFIGIIYVIAVWMVTVHIVSPETLLNVAGLWFPY